MYIYIYTCFIYMCDVIKVTLGTPYASKQCCLLGTTPDKKLNRLSLGGGQKFSKPQIKFAHQR